MRNGCDSTRDSTAPQRHSDPGRPRAQREGESKGAGAGPGWNDARPAPRPNDATTAHPRLTHVAHTGPRTPPTEQRTPGPTLERRDDGTHPQAPPGTTTTATPARPQPDACARHAHTHPPPTCSDAAGGEG
ncbi:hypothetical protein DXG01_014953, partial [Tephrocybe rancida]